MSRVCEICGRGTKSSQTRSHSNIASKRKQYINLQKRKVDGKSIKICTKCIKTTAKNDTN